MRFLRPSLGVILFLITIISIPQSLFSQTAPRPSQPKQPATRQRQPKRPQRADALAAAINELLKLDPLAPGSPDEKRSDGNSENAGDPSEEESKPPADDAPIKELIAYWSYGRYIATNAGGKGPEPSEKIRRRLLEAVEDRPWLANSLFDFLPKTPEAQGLLYRLLNQEPDDETGWKAFVREWLTLNSDYFRDDLLAAISSGARGESGTAAALTSLSTRDWEAARPLIETYAAGNTEILAPAALSMLYAREAQMGDVAKAGEYRARLKAIVASRQAPADTRGAALTALMATEWSGGAEWFLSLFADPSLSGLREDGENKPGGKEASVAKTETEASIAMNRHGRHSPPPPPPPENLLSKAMKEPGEWVPALSSLIGHVNRTVHRAAVKCLLDVMIVEDADLKTRQEAARKLLPWLTEPSWADEEDRANFIRSLADLELSESVAGLIWILDFDESADNRAVAAEALTQYRDTRAIPALRRALDREGKEDLRAKIVTALAECGGFSEAEMAAAIEAYAKVIVAERNDEKIDSPAAVREWLERAAAAERSGQGIDQAGLSGSEKPLPLNVSIGRILHQSETIEFTEGLVVRLIERAKALRAAQPIVAREILSVVEGSYLRVAEVNLVERIGEGWADISSITLALSYRGDLRKNVGNELYGLIKQGGYAAGVAAVIINDDREWKSALEGRDTKAQLSLLAGARYLRDKLPVELVGKSLDSPNRTLAKAAESYLEVEDGAEARKLILARRPGEAYILGGTTVAGAAFDAVRSWEESLRKEIKGRDGLEAIYALARLDSSVYLDGILGKDDSSRSSHITIRVRDGKAEMSLYEVEGRRSVRWLTESEFEELKRFTSRQEVEDLGPEGRSGAEIGRQSYEYLRLTKDGGRRILLNDLWRAPKNPTLHEELSALFYRLSKSGEFIARHTIEDKIPGVEVLFADKRQSASMVCGEGQAIRVFLVAKGVERGLHPESVREWREFSSGKPGRVTDEPRSCRFLNPASATQFYATRGKDPAIRKVEPEKEPVEIVSGAFDNPVVVTPDGKWLVAVKILNEEGKHAPHLIRRNLQTGQEFTVKLPRDGLMHPIAYLAAHGKMLLGRPDHGGDVRPADQNALLDPETGMVQFVKGEFRPLENADLRELQPTENPDEFWAVIGDQRKRAASLGRYDSKNFSFKPVIELPDLRLTSDDIWVDAAAGKIWITYRGHLLRAPMPAKTK